MTPELLAEVHDVGRLRAVGMLDVLSKRELLVEEGGRFRCAHRIIQDVVRQDLGPATLLECIVRLRSLSSRSHRRTRWRTWQDESLFMPIKVASQVWLTSTH